MSPESRAPQPRTQTETQTQTWAPPPTYALMVPDGRTVTYSLYGPEDGAPVVSLLGSPHVRWERPDVIAAFQDAGLRVLVPDRPGYGGSSRRQGRAVADFADDVRALAGAQGWTRFAVTGHSGGGPHALACAALLPDLVTRCAAVAGIAPGDAPELDFLGRDRPGLGTGFLLAAQGEEQLRPRLAKRGTDMVTMSEEEGEDSPGRLQRIRAMFLDGLDGWVDDDLALVRPWGFDVHDITVPVGIWYGTADNRSPQSHADWLLANVPAAEGHEYEGGHEPGGEELRRILVWLGRS